MDHFLSKKEKEDEIEIVELDVSFILEFLRKINKDLPIEIMLLKFYKMKTDNMGNTLKNFRSYVKNKFNVKTDIDLFNIISKNTYIKLTIKIKDMLDALVNREFGCEVYDAKFIDYVVANDKKIVIKIEIKK